MTRPSNAYHWPIFEKVLCGTMNDRERLGLPDKYLAGRFEAEYPAIYDRLRLLKKDELLKLAEQEGTDLLERLVSGNILAELGDPRIDSLNPNMIHITAGKVEIGLPEKDIESVLKAFHGLGLDRKWIAKECPQHKVMLQGYSIAKYPVTNQEYRDFLLDSGYTELPTSWHFRRYPKEYSNHPVYSVSAAAADAYCQWLAKKTGRKFRLPTEAEWEYAASGKEGYEFPWGNSFEADFANTAETGLFQSSPIGAFVDGNTPTGLTDMAGNVEEYVADNYTAYPGGDIISDHLVEIHGTYRIARGGSFARFRDLARTRRRHGHNPRSATYAMGFRLAESNGPKHKG